MAALACTFYAEAYVSPQWDSQAQSYLSNLCCMQAEPRSALTLASREASPLLRLTPSDLILYSAKVSLANCAAL